MTNADEVAAVRAKLGFPPETTFHHLAACVPAKCLVVVASRQADPVRSDRLFVRGFSASQYREIRWPPECNSFDTPVVSHRAPELYVLGEAWHDINSSLTGSGTKAPTRGGGPVGLYRIHLPDGEPELLISAHKPDADWFLSSLLGVTPDGSRLIAVASMTPNPHGGNRRRYSVGLLDPITGEFVECSELPAVFA